jgi:hypothetical protein
MIQKFNKIEEVENPTVGITQKFVQDGIYKRSIEENQGRGKKEIKENEREN